MTEGLRQGSLSDSWAISLLKYVPSLYVHLRLCQAIVGRWLLDFDTGAHLSGICFYVTVVRLCHKTLYPDLSS
jgi:hypothetical protein